MNTPKAKRGCRICGKLDSTRSHLIPSSIFHEARGDDPSMRMGAIFADGHKDMQSGIWDDDILCYDHEQVLGPIDKYAAEFTRAFMNGTLIHKPEDFTIPPGVVDNNMLVRFAASIAWRCSVSCHPYLQQFCIGVAAERRLEQVVFHGGDVSSGPVLALNAIRTRLLPDLKSVMTYPKVIKFDKVRLCRFTLATIQWTLKFDKARSLKFDPLGINGKDHIRMAFIPYEETPEFRAAAEIVPRMAKKRAGWPYKRG